MAARWYVMHVYSGFENKISEVIRESAEKAGLAERIEDIIVPKEEVLEVKRGKRVTTERNVYPGYVLIKIDMSDEVWHLIKNTPKVTGFLGTGNKPQAISESEAKRLIAQLQGGPAGGATMRTVVSYDIGETVRVNDGPFAGMNGTVEDIDEGKGKLKVSVSIFGRPTPVELDFAQVEKG